MNRTCKYCSFVIVAKWFTKDDLQANTQGYCSKTCKKLFDSEKEYLIHKWTEEIYGL